MFAYTLDYLATYPAKQTVCAGVSLLLSQEAAMTREAFEGVLSIKNPSDTSALQDLVIAFEVTDTNGNDCSDRFSINVISRKGFDNNGNIANGGTGTVTVQFVPLLSAAPDVPIPYYFGGTVEYTNPYTRQPETDALLATCLTVNPSPHLTLDYFVPQNIIADDPLTSPLVEKAIPSIVALKIINDGKNTAHDIRLSSVQPSITENSQGLAVSFSMLNSYRDGIQTSIATQDIMLGNMDTGDIHILEYELQSSLMGTLSVNSIDVIHSGTTNDKDLSLVSARAHSLVKAVFQYDEGADSIHDFLTDDIDNGYDRPDSIHFSQGTVTSVKMAYHTDFSRYVSPSDTIIQITVYPNSSGWNYGTTTDPGLGKYEIVSCIRDDNTAIPLDNIWLTYVDLPVGNDPEYVNKLHLLDTISTVRTTVYNVTFRLIGDLLKVDTILHVPTELASLPVDSITVVFNRGIIDIWVFIWALPLTGARLSGASVLRTPTGPSHP